MKQAVPVLSHFGTVEVSTLGANTLERGIVLKDDMTAQFTLVPVSARNGGHDFEMETFDAVGAANDGEWFGHEGRAGEGAQLRTISNTLSKLQADPIKRTAALYVRHPTNHRPESSFLVARLQGGG
jgi:hypothetical protein